MASVEIGSYAFSVRSQAADHGVMQKLSEWLALRAARFLSENQPG
jgi:hypothetical protein